MLIDSYKVTHWMNVRKLTPDQVAQRAAIDDELLSALLQERQAPIPDDAGARLTKVLNIDPLQIAPAPASDLTAIVMTADEVDATRRPIERDGIHFYNYYSMAGAPGRVAPVILDILCPADRLPMLNNGHLEPAITVNIGPGDIHGRWGEVLSDATWQVLRANRDGDNWIAGDSYVEPSYCPHSYSLASDDPARIISYTSESNLAPLVSEMNDWTDEAFAAATRGIGGGGGGDVLRSCLSRRGYDLATAASAAGVDAGRLGAFLLDGDPEALDMGELQTLGRVLGLDYRTLLSAPRAHDEVGKTCLSVDDSRGTVRRFASYTVASMAAAAHMPDLTGLFVRVLRLDELDDALDLIEPGETHYMVRSGALTLVWRSADGSVERAALTPDATVWIAPFVEHAWWGDGAVIKLGSGRHMSYLDQIELSNTFEVVETLRRGRRDALGWGYDTRAGT